MSDSVRPHRRQPTRLRGPRDSLGKNTGVGCHFFLQCMKVKSQSEVAQSFPTLSDPMDCSLPGSSVHGFSRQEYWIGVPLPSLIKCPGWFYLLYLVWGLFSLLDQWVYSFIKFGKIPSIIKIFFFYLPLILNLQITYFTWFDIILNDNSFYSYFSLSTSIWIVNCYVLNFQLFYSAMSTLLLS